VPWRFCSGTWNAFCWQVEGICGSAHRKINWRDDLRVVRLLRPSRSCQTTHPPRKNHHPPGRRRFAPEAWVGDGAPTLPIWNDGVAPNAPSARQRLSKRDGRDAAPSASDFCGLAASVKQHVQLEKIVIRPGDGASRLKFGSAAASRPYPLERRGTPNAPSARQRPSKRDGRDAAPSASDFCGLAASVKQHVQLEKIVVRPGDGASRLKFGSAAASRPYPLERRGTPNAPSARQRLSKEKW